MLYSVKAISLLYRYHSISRKFLPRCLALHLSRRPYAPEILQLQVYRIVMLCAELSTKVENKSYH